MLTNLNKDGVEEPGIPYITEAYYQHRDNAEVVENICVLFMELCDYSESTSRCIMSCPSLLAVYQLAFVVL